MPVPPRTWRCRPAPPCSVRSDLVRRQQNGVILHEGSSPWQADYADPDRGLQKQISTMTARGGPPRKDRGDSFSPKRCEPGAVAASPRRGVEKRMTVGEIFDVYERGDVGLPVRSRSSLCVCNLLQEWRRPDKTRRKVSHQLCNRTSGRRRNPYSRPSSFRDCPAPLCTTWRVPLLRTWHK